MLSIIDEITEGRGANFFVFTDRAQLADSSPPAVDWMTAKGGKVRLHGGWLRC
jgi:hypothetical protein